MSKAGLTHKQREIYDFLRLYHKAHGVYPSIREIGSGLIEGRQVLSKRGHTSVHRMMGALQERGWIDVLPHRPRGITIL